MHITAGVITGAAYIFNCNNSGGCEYAQKLTSETSVDLDQFGHSVAINDEFIVVGAPQHDLDEVSNTGAAYIFERLEGTNEYEKVGDLFSPSPSISAQFGWSVAVNSNGIIAVGAKGDRIAIGSVYIFKQAESTWEHIFTLEPDVSPSFPNVGNAGWSVAINDE